MTPQTTQNVLRFITVSSALSKRALDALAVKQTAEKQAAEVIPPLLTQMLETGAITAGDKQAAEQMMQNHSSTLVLLKNAVTELATVKGELQKKASATGYPVNDGHNGNGSNDPERSLTSPFVGLRTSEKKASDVAFERGMGLA